MKLITDEFKNDEINNVNKVLLRAKLSDLRS